MNIIYHDVFKIDMSITTIVERSFCGSPGWILLVTTMSLCTQDQEHPKQAYGGSVAD
jgi:hypothetical protein